MSRIVCGRGAKGAIVEQVQYPLKERGIYTKGVDGDFGPGTERAVQEFQGRSQLPATGEIDAACWTALVDAPAPTLRERCLQLTSAIEGHGFGLIAGNWDGAWLTWGIIGFTLKHGELPAIVLEVEGQKPEAVRAAFGEKSDELLAMMRAPPDQQEAWADSISVQPKKYRVAEPWLSAFDAFGGDPLVQAVQIRRADLGYFRPALATAGRYGLVSELGVALCFDIHVQNGGIRTAAADDIASAVKASPPPDECARREIIARAVASNSLPQFRQNVLDRKLTIARGTGSANGRDYLLDRWGLDESTAVTV